MKWLILVVLLAIPAQLSATPPVTQAKKPATAVAGFKSRAKMWREHRAKVRLGKLLREAEYHPVFRRDIWAVRRDMTGDVLRGYGGRLEVFGTPGRSWLSYVPGSVEKLGRRQIRVSHLPATGALDVLLLLPVTGGKSTSEVQKLADTNVYEVSVRHADGRVERFGPIPSKGAVTPFAAALDLKPGSTLIEFHARATPESERGARQHQVELLWDGNR